MTMTAKVIATVIWTSTASSSNSSITPDEGLHIPQNATEGDPHMWKDGVSMFLSVVLSLIIVASIAGNTLELVVILKSRRMRTKTNIFIANLAVADLGVTLLCMPFSLVTLLAGDYIFSMRVCAVNAFCDALFLLASIHGLLGVSIQKYFALVRPLSFAITQRRISYMIAVAWALAFLTAIGPVLGWTDTVYKPGSSQCGPKYPETVAEYAHGYFNILIGLVIPLSVFIFVYISVFVAMRRYSGRLRRNTTYGEEKIFKQQMKIVKTIFWIVVVFLLLWSPYFIYASWILIGDFTKLPIWFNTFAYMCGYTNSALNPVIYGLRTKSFRRELKRMFGFKSGTLNQSEVQSQALPNTLKPTLGFLEDRDASGTLTPSQSVESFQLMNNTLIRTNDVSVFQEQLLEVYRTTGNAGRQERNAYHETWVDLLNKERRPPESAPLKKLERVFSEGQKDERFKEPGDDVPGLMSYLSCPTGVPDEYVL